MKDTGRENVKAEGDRIGEVNTGPGRHREIEKRQ